MKYLFGESDPIMATESLTPVRPSAILILLYVGLHEAWRRFVFDGNNYFILRQLLFILCVIIYYKWKSQNIRLKDLFGIGSLQPGSVKVLLFFLPLCIICRITVHYLLFPQTDFLPLLTKDQSGTMLNLGRFMEESFIAPINEEIVFRGLFLSILLRELKNHALFAVFLSALIFANIHAVDARVFIGTYFQAFLVYGPAYVRTRSVAVCIVLHSLWNTLIFVPFP